MKSPTIMKKMKRKNKNENNNNNNNNKHSKNDNEMIEIVFEEEEEENENNEESSDDSSGCYYFEEEKGERERDEEGSEQEEEYEEEEELVTCHEEDDDDYDVAAGAAGAADSGSSEFYNDGEVHIDNENSNCYFDHHDDDDNSEFDEDDGSDVDLNEYSYYHTPGTITTTTTTTTTNNNNNHKDEDDNNNNHNTTNKVVTPETIAEKEQHSSLFSGGAFRTPRFPTMGRGGGDTATTNNNNNNTAGAVAGSSSGRTLNSVGSSGRMKGLSWPPISKRFSSGTTYPEYMLRRQSGSERFITDDKRFLSTVKKYVTYAKDIVTPFFVLNLIMIVAWSCICAYFAEHFRIQHNQRQKILAALAEQDDDIIFQYQNHRILDWVDNTRLSITVLGGLFTFSLVFRFDQCYARWWEGRIIWENIITTSLNLAQQSYIWISDPAMADRLGRFIIVFPYTCKAQLRNKSLGDDGESGKELIERGRLTSEELDDMEAHPCWQPLYVLDIIRTILGQAFLHEGYLIFGDLSHPVCKENFKFFEDCVMKLATYAGDAARVRSAGLPRSYDAMHFLFLYMYFIIAPVAWSPSMGWCLPILTFFVASIIMALISMGTSLVDPFGTDVVDLPIDLFCITIELQIREIRNRNRDKYTTKNMLAKTSTTSLEKSERTPTIPRQMKYSPILNMD